MMIEKQVAFFKKMADWQKWCVANNQDFVDGDAWRSSDPLKCPHCQQVTTYQAMLVFNGRSHTMNSYHLNRLARDYIRIVNGQPSWDPADYEAAGAAWEALSDDTLKCVYGGNFPEGQKDYDHFEGQ